MTISKILELYARSGRSLTDNGLDEAALPLRDADAALELFCQQRWRVLGGDVYRLMDGNRFKSAYDNWSYEGTNIEESFAVARNFIASIADRTMYVVFVVEDCKRWLPRCWRLFGAMTTLKLPTNWGLPCSASSCHGQARGLMPQEDGTSGLA
ncbi:hypothetical protein [Cupriavidus sp. H18C1]|uniref:hypothetical protein n=1 Tax=Cupriavidus sp. H18C1 TaxID=3241601 RepID=UPI003BB85346